MCVCSHIPTLYPVFFPSGAREGDLGLSRVSALRENPNTPYANRYTALTHGIRTLNLFFYDTPERADEGPVGALLIYYSSSRSHPDRILYAIIGWIRGRRSIFIAGRG